MYSLTYCIPGSCRKTNSTETIAVLSQLQLLDVMCEQLFLLSCSIGRTVMPSTRPVSGS